MSDDIVSLHECLKKLVKEEECIKSLLVNVKHQIGKLKVESMHNSSLSAGERVEQSESDTEADLDDIAIKTLLNNLDCAEEINQTTLDLRVNNIIAEGRDFEEEEEEEEEEDDEDENKRDSEADLDSEYIIS